MRKITGKCIDNNIRKAPPREMLRIFGGPFTIEEFRDTFETFDDTRKNTFNMVNYPMIAYNVQVEHHVKTIMRDESHATVLDSKRIERVEDSIKNTKSSNNTIPVVKNFVKTNLSDFFKI